MLKARWLSTVLEIPGFIIFRKKSIRALGRGNSLFHLIPALVFILVAATMLIVAQPGNGDGSILQLVWRVVQVPLLAIFFSLILLVLCHPLLNYMLKSGSEDEAEIHWWNSHLFASRIFLFYSFSISLLFYAISSLFLQNDSIFQLWLLALISIHGFFMLVMSIRLYWNYPMFSAMALAIGSALVLLLVITLASIYFLFAIFCFFLFSAFAPIALKDTFLCLRLKHLCSELEKEKSLPWKKLEMLKELGHQSGCRKLVSEFVNSCNLNQLSDSDGSFKKRLLLHCSAGNFMEAIDAGLQLYKQGTADEQVHCLLAEASLGVMDGENAVAHAEEALDQLGGSISSADGSEALLIFAYGSFAQEEYESGMNAVTRIVNFHMKSEDLRLKRIVREARYLFQKYSFTREVDLA